MWNWVSEHSFRETVESYTDIGLITELISAHLRSSSRSSDYSYWTFALIRGYSITPPKQNHHDWPTHLARWICALLPWSWCPCCYKLGWWMNDHAGHMPHQTVVSLPLWICIWAGSETSLFKDSSVATVPCIISQHSKTSLVRKVQREMLENLKKQKASFCIIWGKLSDKNYLPRWDFLPFSVLPGFSVCAKLWLV